MSYVNSKIQYEPKKNLMYFLKVERILKELNKNHQGKIF